MIYYSDPDCNFIATKENSQSVRTECTKIEDEDGETKRYIRHFCDEGNFVSYIYLDDKCS